MRLYARLCKTYPSGVRVEGEWSISTEAGRVSALFGPSGCGKTTWLRCLAGLEAPDHGLIEWENECWLDTQRQIHRSPQARGIGFLFQSNSLFPHLTVEQNIGYSLRGVEHAVKRQSIADMLFRFQLIGLEKRYPKEISAGQAQRVGLARAIVARPRVLLLDEPFSALDTPLRTELRWELKSILRELGIPTILVTHDRVEAMSLAEDGILLCGGRIIEQGPLDDWMFHPKSLDSARSIGFENIFPCSLLESPGRDSMDTSMVGGSNSEGTSGAMIHARLTEYPLAICGRSNSGSSDDPGDSPRDRVVPTQLFACFSSHSVEVQFPPQPKKENEEAQTNLWLGRVKNVSHEGDSVRLVIDVGVDVVASLPRRTWDEAKPALHGVTVAVPSDAIQMVTCGSK